MKITASETAVEKFLMDLRNIRVTIQRECTWRSWSRSDGFQRCERHDITGGVART